MRILRWAHGRDKFGEIAAMKMGLRIEESYGGSVPGTRDKTAGPECPLGGRALWDEGENVRYDLSRE